MSKINEISCTVGQVIQVKQFEPRTYSVTIKASIEDGDIVEDELKTIKEKANTEVKEYFEGLLKPESETDNKLDTLSCMPEILSHPNIPKPLHGIAPRTIKGQKWWEKTRQEVYKSTDYHCAACGVHKDNAKCHKWLEAHEYWTIDYEKGIAKIEKIVPLCHYCHNFIHSGRLQMIMGKEKSEQEVKDILEHGFKVLADNDLKCFPGTLELAESIGAETYGVDSYELPESEIEWGEWRLEFEGKEYTSQFKDYEEWEEHYRKLNEGEI